MASLRRLEEKTRGEKKWVERGTWMIVGGRVACRSGWRACTAMARVGEVACRWRAAGPGLWTTGPSRDPNRYCDSARRANKLLNKAVQCICFACMTTQSSRQECSCGWHPATSQWSIQSRNCLLVGIALCSRRDAILQ